MRLQTLSEARWILFFVALLSVAGAAFSAWLWWFFFLLFLFTVAFFRDPERTAPADPNLIVAAADGTVVDIVESDENQVLKKRTRRVGIFLSIFDVHTNRAPVDGRVIYRQHRAGLCLDARRDRGASDYRRNCATHRGMGANWRRIEERRAVRNDSLRFANRIIFAAQR